MCKTNLFGIAGAGVLVFAATQAEAHCPVDGACGESSLKAGEVIPLGVPNRTPLETHTATLPVGSDAALNTSGLMIEGTSVNNAAGINIAINPGPDLAANSAALGAFNRAAAQWEAFIADPITVTIDADLASLGPGILGSSANRIFSSPFDTVRAALVADSAVEGDDSIVNSLPTAATFSANLPIDFTLGSSLAATPATFRALGFGAAVDDTLEDLGDTADSTITFSTNFNFDFDNSDGIAPGTFDFESIALHEIGHSLGFISAVDLVDEDIRDGTPGTVSASVLDLFRFDEDSDNNPDNALDFASATRSLVPGSGDILDQVLDEGLGDIEVLLATGAFNGDGGQASHFAEGLGLGVLDPFFASGEVVTLSENDIRALDLIGFDIVVPEPASGLLLLGAGGCLLAVRRRA